ncbi:sialate O-acetylesterase [Winogradskyella sp.]|uniref:sialate O-acetylesterase n=1 Tax=Winogradskyella sp. TaxID=1883156 RepID=UPI003F6B75EA
MWRTHYILILVVILTFSISCKEDKSSIINKTQLDKTKFYDVVIMAGQSNMVGLGDLKELENDTLPNNIVYINHGTDTEFNILTNTFGPEISLSQYLNKRFPNRNFILIKYAIGGSSIKDWVDIDGLNRDNNQSTGHLLDELKSFTDDILNGYNHRVCALLWSQGETDATSETLSRDYEAYFMQLISQTRSKFNNNNLPIIYTELSAKAVKPNAKEILNTSLLRISKTIPHTYYTRTNDLKLQSDSLHYSESALLKLGKRFGTILENVLVIERDN